MIDKFAAWIKPTKEKLENLLKFGSYTRATGSNGSYQSIQIKSVRGLEDAIKMGQFGFNSKAPADSRAIIAKIGDRNIIISNEKIDQIIDISEGNTIIYNTQGNYVKVENDTITAKASNFIINSTNTTINATSKFTVNSPVSEFSNNVNVLGLLSASAYSGLLGSAMSTNVNLETTADVVASGISLTDHTHPYTWTDPAGSGNTSVPN